MALRYSLLPGSHKRQDPDGERLLVAVKPGDHGMQCRRRFEPRQVERVAGPMGEQIEEDVLRSAVSFAEWMDGIQFR